MQSPGLPLPNGFLRGRFSWIVSRKGAFLRVPPFSKIDQFYWVLAQRWYVNSSLCGTFCVCSVALSQVGSGMSEIVVVVELSEHCSTAVLHDFMSTCRVQGSPFQTDSFEVDFPGFSAGKVLFRGFPLLAKSTNFAGFWHRAGMSIVAYVGHSVFAVWHCPKWEVGCQRWWL